MTVTTRASDPLIPHGFKVSATSLLLSTFAINILSLALPVMTLQIYDRIIPNPGSGTLPVLISGVCLAIMLEAMLRLTRSYILGWSGAAYEHRLACSAMAHTLQVDLSQLGSFGIGEHLHRMAAIGKLKDFYSGYALSTLCELIFVPIFLGVIIYIAGPLAAIPAAILMIFTIVSLAQGQKLRAALKKRDDTDDQRYNFLIESLEGIHTVKSFALENHFARRYERLEETSSLANFRVTETMAGTFNAGTVFSHLMVAAITAGGAVLALQGHITTGGLVATVLLSGRMMQPLQRALALWAKYQDFALARGKVEMLFQLPRYINIAVNDDVSPQPAEKDGALSLRNISLGGRDGRAKIIDNLTVNFDPGESLLLSADHEETKTALLEMIAGIYPPDQGEISIDGRPSGQYTPENLINHVAYIPPEGLIFRGTIRDNMTCFGQVSERQAQDMAALLQVNRDIARLPSGFDTFLSGNSTDSIPPGLKQKIAIVRVLAPRPHIILFDNADRALDREGYNIVYDLLARLKGRATMILVSDDYNIRGLASRAAHLQDGKLIEENLDVSTGYLQPYRELQL